LLNLNHVDYYRRSLKKEAGIRGDSVVWKGPLADAFDKAVRTLGGLWSSTGGNFEGDGRELTRTDWSNVYSHLRANEERDP
jgi:hypothetical protein